MAPSSSKCSHTKPSRDNRSAGSGQQGERKEQLTGSDAWKNAKGHYKEGGFLLKS